MLFDFWNNSYRKIYDIEMSTAQRQLDNIQEEIDRENNLLDEVAYQTECSYDETRQLMCKVLCIDNSIYSNQIDRQTQADR